MHTQSTVRTILWLMAAALLADHALAGDTPAPPSNHWLLDVAESDDRFMRIEQQFGGFSGAMWAVRERYERVYEALVDGNLPLAAYHWDKIGEHIRLGYLRRPGRRPNADALFLDGQWQAAGKVFQGEDIAAARAAFLEARKACMACHVAERVPFMNDQPLFRRTESFP